MPSSPILSESLLGSRNFQWIPLLRVSLIMINSIIKHDNMHVLQHSYKTYPFLSHSINHDIWSMYSCIGANQMKMKFGTTKLLQEVHSCRHQGRSVPQKMAVFTPQLFSVYILYEFCCKTGISDCLGLSFWTNMFVQFLQTKIYLVFIFII